MDSDSDSAQSLDEDEQRLWEAVSRGDYAAAKKVFDDVLADPNDRTLLSSLAETSDPRTGETVLMVACRRNDVDIFRLLMEKGHGTEGGDPNHRPPGMMAEPPVPAYFVNIVDKRLNTALHRAVAVRNDEMINALLDEGRLRMSASGLIRICSGGGCP